MLTPQRVDVGSVADLDISSRGGIVATSSGGVYYWPQSSYYSYDMPDVSGYVVEVAVGGSGGNFHWCARISNSAASSR